MAMSAQKVRNLQRQLNRLGFGPLTVDGDLGPKTRAAHAAATAAQAKLKRRDYVADTPWMAEALSVQGLHEARDHAELSAWLRSDGETVGDPRNIPWCGDFVETAISLTIPDEILPTNPYLAASWATKFGVHCEPQYGAVMSFWRGSPTSWKGHVAFYVAEDDEAYHVLGGNQRNTVSITRIGKGRLRPNGSRWPQSLVSPTGKARLIARGDDPLSHNEA